MFGCLVVFRPALEFGFSTVFLRGDFPLELLSLYCHQQSCRLTKKVDLRAMNESRRAQVSSACIRYGSGALVSRDAKPAFGRDVQMIELGKACIRDHPTQSRRYVSARLRRGLCILEAS